jgi:aspartokinase/homoserine dehydrogenase 1
VQCQHNPVRVATNHIISNALLLFCPRQEFSLIANSSNMSMHILKFGGTSVANAANMKLVADIFLKHPATQKWVVVSAMGGTTDQLIRCGELAEQANEQYKALLEAIEARHIQCIRDLLPISQQSSCLSTCKQLLNELEDICEGVLRLGELSARSKDKIVSYGELLSSRIISGYLAATGVAHTWLDAREAIKTDSQFGNAQVVFAVTNALIRQHTPYESSFLGVVPGFISSNEKDQTTTLGRGGSDYTAAIFAAALQANALEIWTDVSGMMTADPRWVTNAKLLRSLSYPEAMELSHFGAKVIYPPTIQPAMQSQIPIWIKNTFEPENPGTLIQQEAPADSSLIRGISSLSGISLLSLEGSGMVGIPGFSKRLFEALAQQRINVILITQGSSEHSICVGINSREASEACSAVNKAFEQEMGTGKLLPLQVEDELAIIALVGDKMKSHPGISGQMFSALGRNGINVRAIAQGSSEKNISAVISASDIRKAVNVLHESFFEETRRQLNLFVVGTGNVGKRFLKQLGQQQDLLAEKHRLQIRLTGISNSRTMYFSDEGINPEEWSDRLAEGEAQTPDLLAEAVRRRNLRNTVFVDITASDEIAALYEPMLRRSIAVVACNKVAAASKYENYERLKSLAREYNTSFLFETNVGAGLPVIGTLNDLVRSGDVVHRIEAVLSGTLNYVFNHYDASVPFAHIVKRAQDEGYTEPDPRLDLGGTDVMRKILILAREAGYRQEMEDISNESFLPASCMQGSVADFYREMENHEPHFRQLLAQANEAGCKLKYVASFHDGKASVGLKHISPDSDFYHLYGKDNIVAFYTDRYPIQPLMIKGSGAGADVTAAGVFADVMRVMSY